MAVDADTLLDRLYLKSQVTRWRLVAIAVAVLALVFALERASPHSSMEKEFVARVTLDGIIGDDQAFYDLLDDVRENHKAKALILWLDTPGGSAVGGEEIFLRLRELAKEKPVVAVMRQVAASAGYMAALGADHIIAREGTITGSIGVLIEGAEVTELAQKLGIKPVIVKSSDLKGTPSPLEKLTPETEQAVHQLIMDFYNRFVDMVAERRKLPRGMALQLADGRIYSGRRALDNKLIDALGGESEALAWLEKTHNLSSELPIKDIEIEETSHWFDTLSQSLAGKFFQKSGLGLDGLSAVWHPRLQ